MKSIAFFNNKGGVGKTTLIYHVACMMSEMGYRVVVADLDPQANLSSMFLSESVLYEKIEDKMSITEALKPLVKGIGDIGEPYLEHITNNLSLIIGDLELSAFEDRLSDSWTKCLNKDEPAFRFISSFYRIIEKAATKQQADFVLIDVGPNLGAINRAALISADNIIIPVGADLFSVQGMTNVGKTLKEWRDEWQDRLKRSPEPTLLLPKGIMRPIGYVISQHGIKERRPVKAYSKWADKIPAIYHQSVLGNDDSEIPTTNNDVNCLGLLKHFRSLMPMAMEVNKPIFLLKPADGAIGAHYEAVQKAYSDFEQLTKKIIEKVQ